MIKAKGNMYSWVTHTWSPIRGCPHQCSYCYVRHYGVLTPEPRLVQKILNENLGVKNKIFVCHMSDMFADGVPENFIIKVLDRCRIFNLNHYVFQTKNPYRYDIEKFFNRLSFSLGTTIETDNANLIQSNAPHPFNRVLAMRHVKNLHDIETFITIEPIMKFSADFWRWIVDAKPSFVNIGADSKGHGLSEPTYAEVRELVDRLKKAGIPIKIKSNMARLRKT